MASPSIDLGPALSLLSRTPVSALCKAGQDVVTLSHNLTVGDTLRIMARHRILSAPLVLEPDLEELSAEGPADLTPTFLGWLDIGDILRAYVESLRQSAASGALDASLGSPRGLHTPRRSSFASGGGTESPGRGAESPGRGESPSPSAGAGSAPPQLRRESPLSREAAPPSLQRDSPLAARAPALPALPTPACWGGLPTKMLALMALMDRASGAFMQRRLVTVRGSEDRSLVFARQGRSLSLASAIRDLFLSPRNHQATSVKTVHRIALFDAKGDVTSVISQSDVVRFLLAHVDELGDAADASVAQLGLVGGPVVAVDAHCPTLMAYAALAERHLSGGPVLAPDETLLANLSVSDLRALTAEHLSVLALPVAEFLAVQHNTSYLGYSVHASGAKGHAFFGAPRHAPDSALGLKEKREDVRTFTVTSKTLLRELLHAFVNNHVHRVYVVDDAQGQKVKAVISLTDVLRLVVGEPGKE